MKYDLSLLTGLLVLVNGFATTYGANITFGTGANEFLMSFVEIGDPGNAPDPVRLSTPRGSVANTFYMGTYEVSRDMITKANAAGGLGIPLFDMTPYWGAGNGGDLPMTAISWYRAATFVNWMNTSQGFHEAYSFESFNNLLFWSSEEAWQVGGENRLRHKDARYYLPSMDEWYKAAYYDPLTDSYTLYTTGSDTVPTTTSGGTAAGTAVYQDETNPDPIGAAVITNAGGLSSFGTMAQGGNVQELIETVFGSVTTDTTRSRELRGGGWSNTENTLRSTFGSALSPDLNNIFVGFRVAASVVPEPSRALLSLVGIAAIGLRRRRSRGCEIDGGTPPLQVEPSV